MIKLSPLLALLFLPLAAFGKETAYSALRLIGAERDAALMNRVLELKGRGGVPQPEKWVVILDDPLARGGVREVEVAGGRIVSERTPIKLYPGSASGVAMNFKKLNLDSEGAFTLAEQQAKRARVGFDLVDYELRCEDANAAPLWVLQLLDRYHRPVGKVTIAADSGVIVASSFGETPRFGAANAPIDAGRPGFLYRAKRSIYRAAADAQEWTVGERTWDREFRNDPE